MRTKLFLIACAAIIICATSCKEEKSKGRIEDAFMEYVKTDFGNPSDFIEITKFDKKDTISNEWVMGYLNKLDSLTISNEWVMGYLNKLDSLEWALSEKQKKQLAWLKHKNSENNTFIVQHKIKVRVKSGKDNREVIDYYVIEKNGEYTVQDHELRGDEMPDEIVDALNLLKGVTEVLKIINGSY